MTPRLSFRAVERDDLRLLHEWLQRPHVHKWWSEHETYDDVVAHYVPAIEGRRPTDLYLIVLDERAVGFIQTYLVADYPDSATRVDVGENVAGVDLLLGDEDLTGKGLGSEVLRVFVRDVVFARPETIACIADPDVRNSASLRAFANAGFQRVRDFFDESVDETHALMRLDRTTN